MKQTLIILLFTPLFLKAQTKWYHLTKYDRWGCEATAFSGVGDAFSQAIQFHGYGKGNSWIDYSISWKNKYKNWDGGDKRPAYFGSTKFLVFTTDAYHLARFTDHMGMYASMIISNDDMWQYAKKDKWKVIVVKKLALPLIVRYIVFNILYSRLGAFGRK
jgi:hypothetical protein